MVTYVIIAASIMGIRFPINECHQRVVTLINVDEKHAIVNAFPINKCRQRVVTLNGRRIACHKIALFPINKCHQRVVTHFTIAILLMFLYNSFQSISVTSEW